MITSLFGVLIWSQSSSQSWTVRPARLRRVLLQLRVERPVQPKTRAPSLPQRNPNALRTQQASPSKEVSLSHLRSQGQAKENPYLDCRSAVQKILCLYVFCVLCHPTKNMKYIYINCMCSKVSDVAVPRSSRRSCRTNCPRLWWVSSRWKVPQHSRRFTAQNSFKKGRKNNGKQIS